MATAGRPSSDAMRERARYSVLINSMSSWAVIDFYVKTHAHLAGAGAEDVQWDDEFAATVKQLLKSEMRDVRSPRRLELIALADSQLRGTLHLARRELNRLPDLAPVDLDWAMLMMHHAASCDIETRLSVCVDAATYPESKGKKFMEIRYIMKEDPTADDYAWIFTAHKSLDVDHARSGHKYSHLEFNDHPGMDPGCRALFMRIANANMSMGSFESELADRVVNNMPYGSSFRMQLDGQWMAYNQATGDELDVLELSAAPMPSHAATDPTTDHDPNFDLDGMD